MLREYSVRKLFKFEGCKRFFEEVMFEMRFEDREWVLGEEGIGGDSLGRGFEVGRGDLRIWKIVLMLLWYIREGLRLGVGSSYGLLGFVGFSFYFTRKGKVVNEF